MRTSKADSTLGRTRNSGAIFEVTSASRSRTPASVWMLFTRRPNPGCGRPKNSTSVARALSLSGSETASSRSRITPSAPAAAALAKRSDRFPGVNSSTRHAPTSRIAGFRVRRLGGALVHQQVAPIGQHQLAPLVVGARIDGEDAFVGARLRLALVDDGRLRLGGVAGIDRDRKLDVGPAEVRHHPAESAR